MSYDDYVARLKNRHGSEFTDSALAPEFRKFFGRRIEVRFSCGTVKRGYVSGTTGWRPSLMLLLRRTSSGSTWLLGERDTVVRTFNEWR